jgi:hypothetical protein
MPWIRFEARNARNVEFAAHLLIDAGYSGFLCKLIKQDSYLDPKTKRFWIKAGFTDESFYQQEVFGEIEFYDQRCLTKHGEMLNGRRGWFLLDSARLRESLVDQAMTHCGECGTEKGLTYFKGRHLCPACLARLEHVRPPKTTDIPVSC